MALVNTQIISGMALEQNSSSAPYSQTVTMDADTQSQNEKPTLKDLSLSSPPPSFSVPEDVSSVANAEAVAKNSMLGGPNLFPSEPHPSLNEVDAMALPKLEETPHIKGQLNSGLPLDPVNDPIAAASEVEDSIVHVPPSAVDDETQNQADQPGMEIVAQGFEDETTTKGVITNGAIGSPTGARNDSVDVPPLATPMAEDAMDTSILTDTKPDPANMDLPHHPITLDTQTPMTESPDQALPKLAEDGPQLQLDTPPVQVSTAQELQAPSQDLIMQDVPLSPGKVARSREDEDIEDEPAMKRMRAEDEGPQASEFKVPDIPQPTTEHTSVGSTSTQTNQPIASTPALHKQDTSLPMTKLQHKILLRGLQNMKRTKDAQAFNAPVDPVLLNIPTYPDIVKTPMDLKIIEERFKADGYPTIDAYLADFNQVVQNSVLFNGTEHPVTKNAFNLKATLEKQLSNLPPPDATEPRPADKKSKKGSISTGPKAPLRRESRSSLGNPKTPTSATSPQTFALKPSGIPQIRRDSTATDGRPKREIHPPASRDLPYSNQKPKRKKYLWELKFCEEVIKEMKKPKYTTVGWPFATPVDPVAMNIPSYHKIIKRPMDLSTIEKKLKEGQYENAKEFESDMRLMFANCYKFNPPTDSVHGLGKQYEAIFDDKWAEKKQWIEDHAPASGPQSPGSSSGEEEEEEEEDEEEEEEESELSILQKQILAMSKQVELIQKKKASPPAPTKKAPKSSKPTKKETKKSVSHPPPKAERKNSTKLGKPSKNTQYVTYDQKQEISNRINTLPENRMATALTIIRDNMPNLKGVQEDEIELDIDELSNDVLHQLYKFVKKYAPRATDSPEPRPVPVQTAAAPTRPKKNKPMSKNEQEAKIQEIQGKLSRFQKGVEETEQETYGHAQPQTAEDTSGDDVSEESEEE